MKHALLVMVTATLAGCVSDPSADPFMPDQVTTGLYQLDVATVADTCDPPRFVGEATVGLFNTPTGIEIFDFGADSSTSELLPEANGYATQTPAGERLDPCPPSIDSVVFSYALTEATSDHVSVVAEETWTLATACPTGELLSVNSSIVPNGSCGATRELHYDLISACAPPCTVVQTPNLTCSCS